MDKVVMSIGGFGVPLWLLVLVAVICIGVWKNWWSPILAWVKAKWGGDSTTTTGKIIAYIERITAAGEKYKTQEMIKCVIEEVEEHEKLDAEKYKAELAALDGLLQKVALWPTSELEE